MVTTVQKRKWCDSMDADPDDRGPEATAQGASVSSDRRAQQRRRDKSGLGRMLTRFKSNRPDVILNSRDLA
jgi:hypothetical protein